MTPDSQQKLIASMIGLLTAGFLAWAGVVWTASQRAIGFLQEVQRDVAITRERVERLALDMSDTRRELRAHEAISIHPGAAAQLERLKVEIEALKGRP